MESLFGGRGYEVDGVMAEEEDFTGAVREEEEEARATIPILTSTEVALTVAIALRWSRVDKERAEPRGGGVG